MGLERWGRNGHGGSKKRHARFPPSNGAYKYSSRRSRRQAHRDALSFNNSCVELVGLLHPTLLEGVRARSGRSIVEKEKWEKPMKYI